MGPLRGVRVVEMAGLASAPFGCMVLADLGCGGAAYRTRGRAGDGLVPPDGPLDRGKHSIKLDLKDLADRETLYALG